MCPPIASTQNLHPEHSLCTQSKSEENNITALFPITSNKFDCSSEEVTLDEKKGFLRMAEAGHSLPWLYHSAVSAFREVQHLGAGTGL